VGDQSRHSRRLFISNIVATCSSRTHRPADTGEPPKGRDVRRRHGGSNLRLVADRQLPHGVRHELVVNREAAVVRAIFSRTRSRPLTASGNLPA
jgi:hypothetical protein